jgi:predicted nucleotidyltransferase
VGEGFDPGRSDLDLLVEFHEPPPGMRLATQFFGLLEELQAAFGRPIDLLEESAIENSRLRRSARSKAVILYAA